VIVSNPLPLYFADALK